ncbi:hypothetical protein ACJX0J_031757, partial [Zea mays]
SIVAVVNLFIMAFFQIYNFYFGGFVIRGRGDVVVLYASIYKDVPMVKGIEECLGKEVMDRINKEGYVDVTSKSVTKESLMERLSNDMHGASLFHQQRVQVI